MDSNKAHEVFAYEQETGNLRWRVSRGKAKAGDVAGRLAKDGYIGVGFAGRQYQAHRIVWLMHAGSWPRQQIDHINGRRADNRIENLREASASENAQNRRQGRGAAGLLGVTRHKYGYQVQIGLHGRLHYIGLYRTAEEAHEAYLAAKRGMHPRGML